MKQSRWMSLVEALTNVLVGYGVAVATQWAVFPLFGLHATLQENLVIGLIFTAVSLVRSYTLRRVFNLVPRRVDSVSSQREKSMLESRFF